jgi:hypothetical protein
VFDGTVLIFDDKKLKPGIHYAIRSNKRLDLIVKYFHTPLDGKLTISIFYSYAEFSNLFQKTQDLSDIMIAQGDIRTPKKTFEKIKVKNFRVMDILGTSLVKNYHLDLPFEVNFLDAKHLFFKRNVAALGKGLNIRANL